MGHLKKAILIASATLCFNLSAFSQGITLKNSNVTVKEANRRDIHSCFHRLM